MDISKFHSYLAAILRSARMRADLTQVEVANRAGVTRRYIQSVENGKQEMSLSTLFVIAEAIGISPSYLVSELESAIKNDQLPTPAIETLPPQRLGRPSKNKK
jgi:transcriptional regulator with XRE-family HTH domain